MLLIPLAKILEFLHGKGQEIRSSVGPPLLDKRHYFVHNSQFLIDLIWICPRKFFKKRWYAVTHRDGIETKLCVFVVWFSEISLYFPEIWNKVCTNIVIK